MKKSLSILLALLMILSSMPIMVFAASAEQAETTNPNVLANYTKDDWGAQYWSEVVESDEPVFLVTSPRSQKIFTVVELEQNTTYNFGFSSKSVLDSGEASYPQSLWVFPYSITGDVFAGCEETDNAIPGTGKWNKGGNFYPVFYRCRFART